MTTELTHHQETHYISEAVEAMAVTPDLAQLLEQAADVREASAATRERMDDAAELKHKITAALLSFSGGQSFANRRLADPQETRENLVSIVDTTQNTIFEKANQITEITEKIEFLKANIADAEVESEHAELVRSEAARKAAREMTHQTAQKEGEVVSPTAAQQEADRAQESRDTKLQLIIDLSQSTQGLVAAKDMLTGEIDGLTEQLAVQIEKVQQAAKPCLMLERAVEVERLLSILNAITRKRGVLPGGIYQPLISAAVQTDNGEN